MNIWNCLEISREEWEAKSDHQKLKLVLDNFHGRRWDADWIREMQHCCVYLNEKLLVYGAENVLEQRRSAIISLIQQAIRLGVEAGIVHVVRPYMPPTSIAGAPFPSPSMPPAFLTDLPVVNEAELVVRASDEELSRG